MMTLAGVPSCFGLGLRMVVSPKFLASAVEPRGSNEA